MAGKILRFSLYNREKGSKGRGSGVGEGEGEITTISRINCLPLWSRPSWAQPRARGQWEWTDTIVDRDSSLGVRSLEFSCHFKVESPYKCLRFVCVFTHFVKWLDNPLFMASKIKGKSKNECGGWGEKIKRKNVSSFCQLEIRYATADSRSALYRWYRGCI